LFGLSNPELEIVQVVRGSARQIAFYDSVNILKTTELVSGTTGFYEQDGLASVTSLTNGSGAAANTYTYDSFGNLTVSSGTLVNPFQYTGRDYDPETGLRYYRARYYNPGTGRFLSEDPVGFEGSGPNFYNYVGGSPLRFVDPLGLSPSSAFACFLKGAAVGAATTVVVGGLAVAAVTLGAPVAAVTGVFFVAGIAGGVAVGWDIYNQRSVHNWDRVAYDVGSVVGSSVTGAFIGPMVGTGINEDSTPGWSPAKDWANRFKLRYPGGSVGKWFGTGPDQPAAGGAAAAAGSGGAMAGRSLCGCD
jgi:RHS repeat-associated protein